MNELSKRIPRESRICRMILGEFGFFRGQVSSL